MNNGLGAQSVQGTEAEFDVWVERHSGDPDFANTARLWWCGNP